MSESGRNLAKWNYVATIASSLAAVFGFFLLIYQLYTDRPHLEINFEGAAFVDIENDEISFIIVSIDAFNEGKRPAGIISSTLNIRFKDNVKIDMKEYPLIPRFFKTNSQGAGAERGNLFLHEPFYSEDFVKDELGQGRPFDRIPKGLQYKPVLFDMGAYHEGCMIFKLTDDIRDKFLSSLSKSKTDTKLTLVLATTDGKRKIEIKEIGILDKNSFVQLFFVFKPDK